MHSDLKRKNYKLRGIILGLISFFLATGLGLCFIFLTDQPYKADIKALQLSEYTGLPENIIFNNYKAAMKFCSPFYNGEFSLPDLRWSEQGAKHFADCKPLFNAFFLLGAIAALVWIVVLASKKLRPTKPELKVAAVSTLALPTVVLAIMAIDFDRAFTLFHQVFFNNDDWLFDWRIDPIILILPEEFFMHCALVIAAFWFAAAAVLLLCGINRNAKKDNLEENNLPAAD